MEDRSFSLNGNHSSISASTFFLVVLGLYLAVSHTFIVWRLWGQGRSLWFSVTRLPAGGTSQKVSSLCPMLPRERANSPRIGSWITFLFIYANFSQVVKYGYGCMLYPTILCENHIMGQVTQEAVFSSFHVLVF